MKRREAREQAFTLIFERSFREEPIEEMIAQATEGRQIEVDEFARRLAALAFERLDAIDQVIQKYSIKWNINRLPKVTLAILRLAICEIDGMEDIPVSVTINEAVELAKKFASEDDASFINGLLGAYVHSKEQGEGEE